MRWNYLDKKMLRLDGFFSNGFYKSIFEGIKRVNGERIKIAGRHSYEKLDVMKINEIFKNKEFVNFINLISCENFNDYEINVKRFRQGDYTLVHDYIAGKGIEFLFILADKWDDKYGGYVVYTDNKSKSMIFSIKGNSFILINKRDVGRFVKYVNHLAGKRSFVLVEGRFY